MINRLWVEAYRPKTVDGYVFRDEVQKKQILNWIKEGSIPHLMLSGSPGIGKTTLAKLLLNELNIPEYDILEMNASRERGIDEVKRRITNFIQMMPFGPFKVVLLDECLDENTKVVILRNGQEQLIEIKDLDDQNDLVKSFNLDKNRIEWKPFKLFNQGVQNTLEIEFENGQVVVCTPDHKWYVEDNSGKPIVVKASELENYMHILST